MAHSEEHPQVTVIPPNKEKIKKLWTVAFSVAFAVPHEFKMTRVTIFILMKIVKAAYIVGEFMHLRHEAKVLIWSILIPMVFVIWMLVAFVYEGFAIFNLRF